LSKSLFSKKIFFILSQGIRRLRKEGWEKKDFKGLSGFKKVFKILLPKSPFSINPKITIFLGILRPIFSLFKREQQSFFKVQK